MAENAHHIQLIIDGETVDIQTPEHDAERLRDYLNSQAGFAAFKSDPKGVLADHNLSISDALAQRLQEAFASSNKISDLRGSDSDECYAWAVAQGSYSIANTKIVAVI